MKNLLVTTLFSGLVLMTAPSEASNFKFTAENSNVDTKLCLKIALNEHRAVKRTVERLSKLRSISASEVVNNTHCNNLKATEFASKYQAIASLKTLKSI